MNDNFGDAIRATRAGYEKINDALVFGPFDKFSGTFIGNILDNNGRETSEKIDIFS